MAKLALNLKPFTVPNFILSEKPSADGHAMTWPIADVPAEVLSELCDAFRRDIFAKAKQKDPILQSSVKLMPFE